MSAPYGSWPAPIDAATLAEAGVGLSQPTAADGVPRWLELRPAERGRTALVAFVDGEPRDVLGPEWNVRTMVHEYGGGAYGVRGGTVWFVEFTDQRLYRIDADGEPRPVTPEPERPRADRYADLEPHADGRVFCVHEHHAANGTVRNAIVQLHDGRVEPVDTAYDFVSSPRVSPDGTLLAWLAWDHPRMPWDGTELRLGRITEAGVTDLVTLAGGTEEALVQPEWTPDGRLTCCSDRTDWWNLYVVDPETGELAALAPMTAEVGHPAWQFGMRSYAWLADGRAVLLPNADGRRSVHVLEPDGQVRTVPTALQPSPWLVADGDAVLCVAGSATDVAQVVRLDLARGAGTVLRESADRPLDVADISRPEPITFPTTGGEVAHANYYPPLNARVTPHEDERPPMLVVSHGGPTSQSPATLSLGVQYWTTRGFAVVDVNYRGSTGYGRTYRQRLRSQWGVLDVDDCVAAAHYLVERGDVDGDRLAIRGGSAGGWTTLCALTFTDVFAAGASHFGVADAGALAAETHKFESRYLDGLIAPWPEGADIYRERSPLYHTERLSAPMILLQGLDDVIVPPSQAEAMVAALHKRGIPHAYLTFEGEQHGFRQASSVIRALEAELGFYSQIFGFEPADAIEPVPIRR